MIWPYRIRVLCLHLIWYDMFYIICIWFDRVWYDMYQWLLRNGYHICTYENDWGWFLNSLLSFRIGWLSRCLAYVLGNVPYKHCQYGYRLSANYYNIAMQPQQNHGATPLWYLCTYFLAKTKRACTSGTGDPSSKMLLY